MSLIKDLRELIAMFHNDDGPAYKNMAQKHLERGIADLERQNAELVRQLAAQSEDVARYRWLRDPNIDVALVIDKRTGYVEPVEGVPGCGGYHTYEYRAGEELDAAIDQAMQAGKEPTK